MTSPVVVHGDLTPLYLQPTTDPNDPSQICYQAADYRLFIATVFPSPGVMSLNDWTISSNSTAILNVGIGSAVVAGTTATEQRSYICRNATAKTIQPPGPPTTSNRYDLIVLTAHDGQIIGDHVYEWQVQCLSGSESSTPGVPNTPNDSIPLAVIIRRPGAANIMAADITDARAVALLPAQPQSQRYWKAESVANSAGFATAETKDASVPNLVLNVTNPATIYRIQLMTQVQSNTAARAVVANIRDGGAVAPIATSQVVSNGERTLYLANTPETLNFYADQTLAVGVHTFGAFGHLASGTGIGYLIGNASAKKQLTVQVVG